jgi:hypothetical protein
MPCIASYDRNDLRSNVVFMEVNVTPSMQTEEKGVPL